MTLPNIKDKIRKALQKSDLKTGLNHFLAAVKSNTELSNSIILQQSRLNSLKKDQRINIISFDNARRTENQIMYAVLSMVDDLEQADLKTDVLQGDGDWNLPSEEPKKDGPLKLFISYSHKDESFKDELKDELIVLERTGKIDIWDDRKLIVGSDFDKEILHQLEVADVVCLLVSRNFIRSEYIWSKEMKKAIQRHEEGTAKIAPIIISRVPNFNILPFANITALPTDAKPITTWEDPNAAWENVGYGITALINALKS